VSILLLIAWVGSLLVLMVAVGFEANGKSGRARQLLLWWSVYPSVYVVIYMLAATLPHNSALQVGTPYCDDDWCMTLEKVSKTATRTGFSYRLVLQLFSLANHGPRSAKGAWVYLTDDRNRRFSPISDPSAVPFDVALEPKKPVETSLTFDVPSNSKTIFFTGGTSGIGYGSFIIGNGGDLFHKPRVRFRIQ
jgi:hypothetical protein